MRVYHFMSSRYGLQNLAFRRLKIATLEDINDPFELLAAASHIPHERRAFRELRRQWAQRFGMLCFSRSWHNPVQWSHYAEKHRGLCFGFDVPDEFLTPISYSAQRLKPDWSAINSANPDDAQSEVMRWSATKFEHWQYEQEVRLFLTLEERSPDEGLYFYEFNEKLQLREIIVGATSAISRADVETLLDDEQKRDVDRYKARLAFGTYRIVRQQKASLWS